MMPLERAKTKQPGEEEEAGDARMLLMEAIASGFE